MGLSVANSFQDNSAKEFSKTTQHIFFGFIKNGTPNTRKTKCSLGLEHIHRRFTKHSIGTP
jgi:hypothetical protein